MKKSLLITILFFATMLLFAQSMSPSIISGPKKSVMPQMETSVFLDSLGNYGLTADSAAFVRLKPNWLIPFTETDNALAEAYQKDGSKFSAVSTVSIRPNIDGSNANSIYVEIASYVPSKLFRIALGSNLVQSDLRDSTSTAQNIAFQKLINGGGNLVLNISRPLIYKGEIASRKKGFFVSNLDLTGYSDIEGLNQDLYNPGWGALFNLSFDMRIVNEQANTPNSTHGNLFRFGFNGRYQHSLFNEKYKIKNNIDETFNNLGIFSLGTYFGIAIFNIQLSYNMYNKSDPFFDEKKWLLRVEVIPVKF